MKVQATSNFEAVYEAYKSGKSGILLEGGSRSGKTVAAVQFFAVLVLTEKGLVITMGRDWLSIFKKTVYLDIKKFFPKMGLPVDFNKSEMTYEFNSNLIQVVGIKDDPQKVHGMGQDIFWVNEGINIPKNTIDQLEQRTEKFFIIDYNPSEEEHYLYDMQRRDDIAFHKTTLLDNPFAPANSVRKIRSYEPTAENIAIGTADPFKWKVYGLGERAKDESLIFRNWEMFKDPPKEGEYRLKLIGGDFGYSDDPAAAVEVIIAGHNLYVTEILYDTWLTNQDIAERLKGYKGIRQIWDSAEPKSIQELRLAGVEAIPAIKGSGSVVFGIQKIKSYKLFVNLKSVNLQRELRAYKWEKEKDGINFRKDAHGRRIPIDKDNHAIDALRYAVTRFLNV